MPAQRSIAAQWLPRPTGRRPQHSGIVVASGYGIQVRVERRHLVVQGGIARDRHKNVLHKATAHLKRLVVIGHTGYITLEAIRWLHDVKAGLLQVDVTGDVLLASAPARTSDARVRRAQALAPTNGVGVVAVRSLIVAKLQRQRETMRLLGSSDAAINALIGQMPKASASKTIRVLEALGAASYWNAWARVSIRWVRQDQPRLPMHWQRFTSRGSPLTGEPRNAADPINAMLNYLYALLEAEARIACLQVGLDPCLGLLH